MSVQSRSLSDSFDFSHIPGDAYASKPLKWLEKVTRPEEGEFVSPLIGVRNQGSPPPLPPPPPPAPVPRSTTPRATPRAVGATAALSLGHGRTLSPTQDGGRQGSGSPNTPSSYNYGRHGPRGTNTSSMYSSPNDYTPTTHRFPADLTAVGSPIAAVETDDSYGAAGALISSLQDDNNGFWGSGGGLRAAGRHPVHSSPDDTARRSPPHPAPHPCPFGNDSSSATAKPVATPSSAYTSAIIQALSMAEGAAMASTNQQSLSSMPLYSSPGGDGGHSASDDDEEEDSEAPGRDGGAAGSSGWRGKGLYEHGMRVRVAKEQWISLEKARQDMLESARLRRDCPFQPRVSPFAAKIRRPASLRPENRARGEMLRKKQWINMKKQAEVERAMEQCTFRPLTLRVARLEEDGNPRTESQVFSELYHEAEARQHFQSAIQPQLVDVMERHVINQGSSGPVVSAEEIQGIVERLSSKAAVVAGRGSDTEGAAAAGPLAIKLAIPEETFKPELSKATKKMVEQKIKSGERDPDIVNDLYGRNEAARLERQLEVALREQAQREAKLAEAAKREEMRERLELERFRTVLAAKYRALGKHAWQTAGNEKKAFRARGPHSVVALSRAALDVLTVEEAEEVLATLENCGVDRVTEAEFVFLALRHAMKRRKEGDDEDDGDAASAAGPAWRQSPLFLVPPPLPSGLRNPSGERHESVRRDPLALTPPPPLPRVKREKADPAVLERVRRRREEQMLEWREEARRRAELAELGDPNDKPAPRRLIPYECRPDVHVPTRTNRAAKLRESRAKGLQQVGDAQDDDDESHRATAPLAIESRRAVKQKAASGRAHTETARSLFPHAANTQAQPLRRGRPPNARQSPPKSQGTPRVTPAAWRVEAPASGAAKPTTAATPSPRPPLHSQSPPKRSANANSGDTSRQPQQAAAAAPVAPTPQALPNERRAAPTSPPKTVAQAGRSRGSSASSQGKDHLHHGVIAEHAAFGGEEALIELGRELLLRQLQEYQQKQSKSR